MSKIKYYVVWKGKKPGIYSTWDQCKDQIDKYPNASYKSYKSKKEAEAAFFGSDIANKQNSICADRSIKELL